jgi:hypothetical protein
MRSIHIYDGGIGKINGEGFSFFFYTLLEIEADLNHKDGDQTQVVTVNKLFAVAFCILNPNSSMRSLRRKCDRRRAVRDANHEVHDKDCYHNDCVLIIKAV